MLVPISIIVVVAGCGGTLLQVSVAVAVAADDMNALRIIDVELLLDDRFKTFDDTDGNLDDLEATNAAAVLVMLGLIK